MNITDNGRTADAETYTTFVFCHQSKESARALTMEMVERFPFAREGDRITALITGDALSVANAMALALECGDLDHRERVDLALEMAGCVNWESCLQLAAKWDLCEKNGAFVDASAVPQADAQPMDIPSEPQP